MRRELDKTSHSKRTATVAGEPVLDERRLIWKGVDAALWVLRACSTATLVAIAALALFHETWRPPRGGRTASVEIECRALVNSCA